MTDGTTIIPPGGLVESSGWQPIETAPMDGTEVVLYYPCYLDGGFVTAGYWRAGTDVYEPHWYSDLVNGGASPPTKWQPLPQPPTLWDMPITFYTQDDVDKLRALLLEASGHVQFGSASEFSRLTLLRKIAVETGQEHTVAEIDKWFSQHVNTVDQSEE